MPIKITHRESGFTLIELLIVIAIVGILAGLVISIINPTLQRNKAEDGVRIANIGKTVNAINAYYAREGIVPQDINGNGNPLDDANGLTSFVNAWPTTGAYEYTSYNNDSVFCLSVMSQERPGTYLKFISGQLGSNPAQCIGIVVKNCPESCPTSGDVSGCQLINETPCT